MIKLFYILLLVLIANSISIAQDFEYKILNTENGLPSDAIYDVFQDSKGFMWFGTAEGLVKYDGFEFKTYSQEGFNDATSCIKEDNYGRIWCENLDGYVFYLQNDTLHSINQHKPYRLHYYGIISDQLFVIQEKGVDIFSLKTLKQIETLPFNYGKITLHFCQQTDSAYYLVLDSIYEIKSSSTIKKIPYNHQNDKYIPSFLVNQKKEILPVSILGETKVAFQLINKVFLGNKIVPIKDRVNSISYVDDKLWYCTHDGVFVFDKSWNQLFSLNGLFKKKNMSSVFKDREGGFWFSTLNEGVLYVPNSNYRKFLNGMDIRAMSVFNSSIFLYSSNGIIYKLNMKTWKVTPFSEKSKNSSYMLVKLDSINKIIFHTAGSFLTNEFKDYRKVELQQFTLKSITSVDNEYQAYSGSDGFGLIKASKMKNEWDSIHFKNIKTSNTHYSLSNFLDKSKSISICFNKLQNSIYCATNIGLYKITPREIKKIKIQDSIDYFTRLGSFSSKIYAETASGKLYEMNANGKLKNLSEQYHLKSEDIQLTKIIDHYLFLVSKNYLRYIDLLTSKLIVTNIKSETIKNINIYENTILIGTTKGLIIASLQDITDIKFSPLLVINNTKVNGLAKKLKTQSTFNHNENNIEIHYSILSFKTNNQFPLYYKVNNHSWKLALSNSRVLQLNELAPNNYIIQFRLGDGIAQQFPVQSIQFTINKPWWYSWWAIVIYVLFVVGLFIIIYKWQTSILKKRNDLLTEKMKLEQSLNKSILTSIKSQMNPHFFYNALNTIQSFIYADDKRNASTYLSKFSKLTRLILEMSEKETITLQEEIEALELYLDIEKIRFNDEMEYDIVIENNLNLNTIKIPSMLIQPYIENAIKHGLLHKRGKKELKIKFGVKNNSLEITIDDNGIGREKSTILNKMKEEKYTSFSSAANLKRIEILNANKEDFGLVIIDKISETGEVLGTKVMINVPLNNYN